MSELKLVRIYVERKFLLPLRLVLFLALLPFLWDMIDAFVTGVATSGRHIRVQGEGIGFYLIILKKFVIAALFAWLATWGLKEKKPDSPEKESEEKR